MVWRQKTLRPVVSSRCALVGTIQVLAVDECPVAKVINVQRRFVSDRTAIDVSVMPLAVLLES